jgi:outer membrane protein OmpA-like peptidoglycan-associated protein
MFLAIAAATTVTRAQLADGRINVFNLTAEREDDSVRVEYTAVIAKRAVKRNHTLVFEPVITGDGFRQSLPAVVVNGPGSKLARERREWIAKEKTEYKDATVTKNNRTVKLTATVPYQDWMSGGQVVLESVDGGCCSYRSQDDILLTRNILEPVKAVEHKPETEPLQEPKAETQLIVPQWIPVTIADSLSIAMHFVIPVSEFDEQEPFKIYDDEREDEMGIYFRVGRRNIDPNYMTNQRAMINLVAAIEMIMSSTDSRVHKIVVGGFASPEGGSALNDKLAFDRAVSVKRYIMDNTSVRDDQIILYNGSSDWRGLRMRVERSNMSEKRELLDIIDNTPIWDKQSRVGRLGRIMRLNGGRTYRVLLNEHFPYLRSGAFIKVYYENQ